MSARRQAFLAAVAYLVLVHVVALWGEGRMTSPLRPTWDAEALAEAPTLARFDAGWFRSVAKEGYSWDPVSGVGNVMLFPLYPSLWRPLGVLGLPLFWAGLLVAHACFAGALILLYAYARREWGGGDEAGRDAIVALLAFPWAFYLLAPYSESLFLLLAVGAFAAARRRRSWLTAALGLLAGLTRLFGLALVPALLWLAWKERGSVASTGLAPPRRRLAAFLAAFAPAAGTAAFFAWLGARFDDPLLFLQAQSSGWAREPGLAGLGRSLALVVENIRERGLLHLGPAVDLLVVVFLVVAAVWLVRHGAAAEALYVAAGAALVVLSGGLLGAGRYALVLFPLLRPLTALRRRPALWYGYLAGAALLQVYLIVRFVNNLWVA